MENFLSINSIKKGTSEVSDSFRKKLIELGYSAIYNDIDPNLLKQMEWFGHLTSGKTHQDFFANRVTDYSKSTADWSDL